LYKIAGKTRLYITSTGVLAASLLVIVPKIMARAEFERSELAIMIIVSSRGMAF
jgi:hypothetical protein